MLIFGTKHSHVATEQLHSENCPHCETQGSVFMAVFAKYFHLYWIPFFSVGKTVTATCGHCKLALPEEQIPSPISAYIPTAKSRSKTPIWQFVGLAIFGIMITFAVMSNREMREKEKNYINNPQAGDMYEYKTEDGNYSSMKVMKVVGSELEVSLNEYSVNKQSGLDKIDLPENFSSEPILMDRGKIELMFDRNEIVGVYREK